MDLVDRELVTDQMTLTVCYDIESLTDPAIRAAYHGEITTDRYERSVRKQAHGTANLERQTSSAKRIGDAAMDLFDRIVNPKLLVRRVNLTASRVHPKG